MLYPILAFGAALAATPLAPVPLGGAARAFSLPAVNADVARSVAGDDEVALHEFTGLGAPRAQAAVILHFFERGAGDQVLADLARVDQGHDDVVVIGVMADPRGLSAVTTWVAGQDLSFPVLFDEHRIVFGRYGVQDSPVTLVIDGEGTVQAIGRPMDDSFGADLDKVLAPLLAD